MTGTKICMAKALGTRSRYLDKNCNGTWEMNSNFTQFAKRIDFPEDMI